MGLIKAKKCIPCSLVYSWFLCWQWELHQTLYSDILQLVLWEFMALSQVWRKHGTSLDEVLSPMW